MSFTRSMPSILRRSFILGASMLWPLVVNADTQHDEHHSQLTATNRFGSHGMVLLTNGNSLYASHLPLYRRPHDYQLIYRVQTKHADVLKAQLTTGMITLLPEPFDLNALIAGEQKQLQTQFFEGHFERGGLPMGKPSALVFEKPILIRQIPAEARSQVSVLSEQHQLVSLEAAYQYLQVHLISNKPSRDHIRLLDMVNCPVPVQQSAAQAAQVHEPTTAKINQLTKQACVKTVELYLETQDFR